MAQLDRHVVLSGPGVLVPVVKYTRDFRPEAEPISVPWASVPLMRDLLLRDARRFVEHETISSGVTQNSILATCVLLLVYEHSHDTTTADQNDVQELTDFVLRQSFDKMISDLQ